MDYELKSQESFNVKNESGTTILKIDSTGDGGVYIKGVGGYDGAAISSAKTLQDVVSISMTEITWSELKTLRDNSGLTPGMQYRITDYTCTTTQTDTQSANHPFDIIVTADSENTLNENARAIQHSGDTYFANSNLAAWELKYCIDNDTTKFAWADSTNGKGVIYRMIDEFNNDVPYDFKNIQYNKYKGFRYEQWGTIYDFFRDTTLDSDNYYGWRCANRPSAWSNSYCYTTSETPTTSMILYDNTSGRVIDYGGSIVSFSSTSIAGAYTFTYTDSLAFGDASISGLSKSCYNNVIGEYYSSNKQQLNFNILYSTDRTFNCYSNTFGDDCYSNIFGNNCYNNTFGTSCYSNTFGTSCYSNTFGSYCYNNTFGDNCFSNTFGIYCYNNTFGTSCNKNSFGDYFLNNTFDTSCSLNVFGSNCQYNTFSSNCSRNTFGNYCYHNTFGIFCNFNTFGNNCAKIKFGDSSSTKSYYQYIIVENGNRYIYLNCTTTTASFAKYQNVTIAQGVNNTDTYKTITDSNVNQAYKTVYQPANSQTVSI